jgi:hypothetical protein
MIGNDLIELEDLENKVTKKQDEIHSTVDEIMNSLQSKYNQRFQYTIELYPSNTRIEIQISVMQEYSIPDELIKTISEKLEVTNTSIMAMEQGKLKMILKYG